jgi:hypothetical protein
MRDADLVTRQIAGETIIVPVRSQVGDLDSIFTLNDVGTLIWQHLDGRTTVRQMVEAICQVYDITPEEATGDVLDFLTELEGAGLIRSTAST